MGKILLSFLMVFMVVLASTAQAQETSIPSSTESLSELILPGVSLTNQWFMTVGVQSYQPLGTYHAVDGSSVDLSRAGSTVLPNLSAGLYFPSFDFGGYASQWGFDVSAAYLRQDYGYQSVNGSLATMDFAVRPLLRFRWQTKTRLYTVANLEIGNETLTMTSNSASAGFGKQAPFVGYGLGVEYDISAKYGMLAQYVVRQGLGSDADWAPTNSTTRFSFLALF